MRRRRFGRRARRRRGSVLFAVAVIALVMAILLTFADTRMRTQLNAIAASQAKNISTLVINAAVMEVLEANDIKYDDIMQIEYDADRHVSAIKTDSIKMNQLQARITSRISERIGEVNAKEIKIAVGSLTGVDMFNSKGPRIGVHITLAGNAATAIENRFESAGINQTRHQVILSIKTAIYVVLPSGATSAEVLSTFTIAETIIVGQVPEFFAGSGSILPQEQETQKAG